MKKDIPVQIVDQKKLFKKVNGEEKSSIIARVVKSGFRSIERQNLLKLRN